MSTSKTETGERETKTEKLNSYSGMNLINPIFKVISAELRSPVSVIQSNIQLLKNFSDHSVSDFTNETFTFAEDSIENILGFIENLDFLCNSTDSKFKIIPQWFSIRLLINQTFEGLRLKNLDPSRIKINGLIKNSKVFSDKYMVNLILLNLLSNALKFSSREVDLFISTTDNILQIVVRDSGIGIPKKDLKWIFNPLVRGENTKMIAGTGLGLAIITKALESFNGNISVISKIGKGSDFTVIIHSLLSETDMPSKAKLRQPSHLE